HTRCSRDWSSDVCSSDLSEKSKGTQSVYRTVTDPLFPVPLEIHSDYNVYPAQHARLGPNDEVRGNLPYAPDIDSFARWRPCPDRSEERRVGKGGRGWLVE